jgi:signal transduction histidine kinase
MELIDTRAEKVRRAVSENKERLAEDLHDHVIQELFATGMSLQGVLGRLERPEDQRRVSNAVDSLDGVISRIRTAIFALQPQPEDTEGTGLKGAILAVASAHTAQLGYSPDVQFGGFLDSAITAELSDHILAVTREALSNCARHAQATSVTISLQATDDLITLEVTDDGRGLGQPERSSGLTNMRRRAEYEHGTLTVTTPRGGGTRLTWTARRP